MSILNDPELESLLGALHGESEGQLGAVRAYYERRAKEAPLDWDHLDEDADRFFADKMVALERDKAEFCYAQCRALGARRVVEAGSSFGVSTLYLAAAVRDNGLMQRSDRPSEKFAGLVTATEYEPQKAKAARRNFAAAGLADFVDLREGDLRETLKTLEGPIDFLLVDIWTEMAAPALAHVAPRMRKGAVAVADNTQAFRHSYRDYFAVLAREGFRTLTLPFAGGLEMSIKL